MAILLNAPKGFDRSNKLEYMPLISSYCRYKVRHNRHLIFSFVGKPGCLTGDTLINCNRGRGSRRYTLKYMCKQYRLGKEKNKGKKCWDMNIPTYVRSFDGDSIKLHEIKDVIASGHKQIYELTLKNGNKIKATPEHKIMTKRGFIELQNLNYDSDLIMCDTNQGIPKYCKIKSIIKKKIEPTYDIICAEPLHNFVANGIVVHNSGKTYSAIYMGQQVQNKIDGRDFNIEEQLALDASQFFKIVQKATPGTVVIFDEIGTQTGFNSRKSMSAENIALSSLFQTIRSRRLIIILTTPNFTYIDKSLRDLVDFNICAEHIDYDKNICTLKIQELQINKMSNKTYFHFPRVKVSRMGAFIMPHIYAEHPDKEKANTYEKMKFEYQERLNQIIQGQLKKMKDKELGVDGLKPKEKLAFELYQQKVPFLEIYERIGCGANRGRNVLDNALLKLGIEMKHYSYEKSAAHLNEVIKKRKEAEEKKEFEESFKDLKTKPINID